MDVRAVEKEPNDEEICDNHSDFFMDSRCSPWSGTARGPHPGCAVVSMVLRPPSVDDKPAVPGTVNSAVSSPGG